MSIDQHRSTTNPIEFADLIWWPCMGFSALTPLTLSSSMVSGDNIKNRLDLCWLSPATHGLRDSKCHRWVCAVPDDPKGQDVGHVFVHDELSLINISVFSCIFRFNPQTVQPLWSANVLCTFSPPKHEPEGLTHGVVERWFANPLDVFTLVFHVSGCQYSCVVRCNK